MMKKKKFVSDHERSAVWCPLLKRTMPFAVCGKHQAQHERKCRRAEFGHCCPNVDDTRIISAFTIYQEERKSSHA